MQDISDFISTVGFPIVVSVAMFYQNNVLATNYQNMSKELQDKIEANTLVMQHLLDTLKLGPTVKDGTTNDTTNK